MVEIKWIKYIRFNLVLFVSFVDMIRHLPCLSCWFLLPSSSRILRMEMLGFTWVSSQFGDGSNLVSNLSNRNSQTNLMNLILISVFRSVVVMKQTLIVGVMLLIAVVLFPVLWKLWIIAGSANANFFYAITLVFIASQVRISFCSLSIKISYRFMFFGDGQFCFTLSGLFRMWRDVGSRETRVAAKTQCRNSWSHSSGLAMNFRKISAWFSFFRLFWQFVEFLTSKFRIIFLDFSFCFLTGFVCIIIVSITRES